MAKTSVVVSLLVLCYIFFSILPCTVLGAAMYEGIEKYEDTYLLPALPYAEDALEPWMDNTTVNIHYNKHHAGYTRKFNAALAKFRGASTDKCPCKTFSVLKLLRYVKAIPEEFRAGIQNNGGGYINHIFFWAVMSKNGGAERRPSGDLVTAINAEFQSYDNFKANFSAAAGKVFGSGYAWLSRDSSDKLVITTSANQDSPVSDGLNPILVIDVWEHAYYLKHQNRRPEFIDAWWKLVDWVQVDLLDKWWQKQDKVTTTQGTGAASVTMAAYGLLLLSCVCLFQNLNYD